MTDPLAPAVMTYTDKVLQNAEVALKSGSTWVFLIAGVAATIYVAMTPEQVAALVKTFPWLAGWTAPLGVIAAYIIARLKPSDAVSSATKAMVTELAILRLNVLLRARGSPEFPVPVPAPLPVPVTVPVVVPVPAPAPLPAAPAPEPAPPPPIEPAAPVLGAPGPAREPAEPVTRVDVALPLRPVPAEAPELPIDPRLLMSLIQQYLRQQPKP